MALNFPTSPTHGQQYTNGQNTWVYDSTKTSWKNVKNLFSSVRQQFVATANQTTFYPTAGYVPDQIDVYYNGVKLQNGNEVLVGSGSSVILTKGADANSVIEVVGLRPYTITGEVSSTVRQIFTATANQTTFTITGGYTVGQIDVYYNGVKLINGTDVNLSSGTDITLSTGVPANSVIEVVGIQTQAVSAVGQTASPVRQIFTATANQTSFAVSGGYTAGQVDVYLNGVKLVNGTDVIVNSGSNVVLSVGATANSIVEVVGLSAISYADSVKRSGDTFTGQVSVPSLSFSDGSIQTSACSPQAFTTANSAYSLANSAYSLANSAPTLVTVLTYQMAL